LAFTKLGGAWTALVTPFGADGSIHWDEFERLVAFQADQGMTGVLPCGTTGECPTLNWEEHNAVVEAAVRASGDACLVMAGAGSNSTSEALRASRHAVDVGAQAILLVDCYYNGPSSLELRREYHGVVAAACPDTLIVPYIIPGRSGTAMAPEDLAILAEEHPNVRTVKEATGDLDRMAHTRGLVGDDFEIMSGDDGLTAAMMASEAIRADGVISVLSNVVPAPVSRMVQALAAGDPEGRRLADALDPLFDLVTVTVDNERTLRGQAVTVKDKFRNPLAVKTLMRGLGMISGHCRRPLGKMTASGVDVVRSVARAAWQDHPEFLMPIQAAFGVDLAARLDDDALWASLAYPATT